MKEHCDSCAVEVEYTEGKLVWLYDPQRSRCLNLETAESSERPYTIAKKMSRESTRSLIKSRGWQPGSMDYQLRRRDLPLTNSRKPMAAPGKHDSVLLGKNRATVSNECIPYQRTWSPDKELLGRLIKRTDDAKIWRYKGRWWERPWIIRELLLFLPRHQKKYGASSYGNLWGHCEIWFVELNFAKLAMRLQCAWLWSCAMWPCWRSYSKTHVSRSSSVVPTLRRMGKLRRQ